MKVKVFNLENVTPEEVDRKVEKVRAIILNDEGKVLVGNYAGVYLLPGGSIDRDEEEKQALTREILEETGIENVNLENTHFLKLQALDRNYFDRKEKRELNRQTNTTFYYGRTNSSIDLNKQQLTQSEKNSRFKISFENLSILTYLIENNKTTNSKKYVYEREMLTVLKEFAEYRREKYIESER